MQTANAYLELIRKRGKKGLPLERVYRQLFNRDLFLMAYGKIYRNTGAMTHGVTDETPDGMSLEKIDAIIEAVRYERYQWLPARRTYIPKKNGKKRPLGMPVWSDKLVQEVIRLILEAYYDVQFSDQSHGFRHERGCHTALREIHKNWPGTTWFIEGDIAQCFDKLNHNLLLETLSEQIHDGRFINLMRELFDAGYMEDWMFNETLSGVPQGGIVSPILSNVLLNKLDKFVETVLIPRYTKGVRRRASAEYSNLITSSYKRSVSQVREKYSAELVVKGRKYKGLQVNIPRQDKEPLVATWGGISLEWDARAILEDKVPTYYVGRSELVQRLLAEHCEYCGDTEKLEVHHIRAMKHLYEHPGRPKPEWVKRMIALKRKTMILCRTCHDDIHAGRTMRRQIIELMEVKALQRAKTLILESRVR